MFYIFFMMPEISFIQRVPSFIPHLIHSIFLKVISGSQTHEKSTALQPTSHKYFSTCVFVYMQKKNNFIIRPLLCNFFGIYSNLTVSHTNIHLCSSLLIVSCVPDFSFYSHTSVVQTYAQGNLIGKIFFHLFLSKLY